MTNDEIKVLEQQDKDRRERLWQEIEELAKFQIKKQIEKTKKKKGR